MGKKDIHVLWTGVSFDLPKIGHSDLFMARDPTSSHDILPHQVGDIAISSINDILQTMFSIDVM